MLNRIVILGLVALMMVACGAQTQEALPTVMAEDTSQNEESPTQKAETESDNTQSESGSLDLVQTIESETGVTYLLPAEWYTNDNDRVSNFGSDDEAVLDFTSMDEEKKNRWLIIGSISIVTADKVSDLATVSTFEGAATAMHEYYYTADSDIQAPTIVTLENGKKASIAIRNNENIEGAAGTNYFVEAGDGTYIKVAFEARKDIIMDNAALFDAIASSAFIR